MNMPETQETNSLWADPTIKFANLPWGCRMLIDPDTQWPLRAEIIHASGNQDHAESCKFRCQCRKTPLTDKELVVKYMHKTAYFDYYQKDPETFNAWAVNELLENEANRLGLDPGNIWETYPDCIPQTKDLDIRTCPAGVPFHNERHEGDGTVIVFEGKALGPGGRTLAELLAEEDTCEGGKT